MKKFMGTFHVIPKETKEQIRNWIINDRVSVHQTAKDAGISDATVYGWFGRTAQGQQNTTEVLR